MKVRLGRRRILYERTSPRAAYGIIYMDAISSNELRGHDSSKTGQRQVMVPKSQSHEATTRDAAREPNWEIDMYFPRQLPEIRQACLRPAIRGVVSP